MAVAIFLRAQKEPNNFKNVLSYIIEDDNLEKIVLVYPYYMEKKVKTNGIQGTYSILGRGLRNSILLREGYNLTTIAPDDSRNNDWDNSYKNFVKQLNDDIKQSGKKINYKGMILKNQKNFLHAKFTLGYKKIGKDVKPVVLLLGSSNLTNKAYDVFDDYNYETDILLWDNIEYSFDSNVLKDGDLKTMLIENDSYEDTMNYLNYFNSKVIKWYKSEEVEQISEDLK
ncbi:hypothetical protein ACPWSR_16825 [Alloiococcus sp. CFN-8]|uniref:hypothetical protein n=1 Tax=Alloiococcus sp. CFN-8 TaxID=3416081 RepID=UPI003CE9944A